MEQGAFSRTVHAQQGMHFARRDRERNPVQHLLGAESMLDRPKNKRHF